MRHCPFHIAGDTPGSQQPPSPLLPMTLPACSSTRLSRCAQCLRGKLLCTRFADHGSRTTSKTVPSAYSTVFRSSSFVSMRSRFVQKKRLGGYPCTGVPNRNMATKLLRLCLNKLRRRSGFSSSLTVLECVGSGEDRCTGLSRGRPQVSAGSPQGGWNERRLHSFPVAGYRLFQTDGLTAAYT
jgi:hypothetical protein